MEFTCPECEREPFPTLKGWKRHLTSMHGGYSPGQLNDAIGGQSEGTAITGEESLESAILNLPATEAEGEARNIAQEQAAEGEIQQKRELTKEQKAAAKRIKAKFDSLKQRISSDIPEQIFKFGGIELSGSERTLLAESIDTSFEVFGIDFEVQPWNLTIRNPFIVLLYPIIVIAMITIGRIMEQKDEKPE